MKVLYITSLFSLESSSASIRNFGHINGISELIGKENIDILTVKRPNYMYDKYLLENVNCNNIFYNEIDIINKYFSVKEKISLSKKEKLDYKIIKEFKKVIVSNIYFPSIEKAWIDMDTGVDYSNYDTIISSSDSKTSHLVAEKIKLNHPNIKWIQIWGDPWSIDITLDKLTKFRAKRYERELIKKADFVYYVSEPTKEKMQELYPKYRDKIKYLPRGYPSEAIGESENNNEISLVYTGALNLGRNIKELAKALDELNQKNALNIYMNIYGSVEKEYKECIDNSNYINLMGTMPYNDIIEIYKKSDILVYIGNETGTTQIPGKLYDYYGTNKQILAIVNGEDNIKKFIESTNRSVVVNNKKDEIIGGIEYIISQIKQNKKVKPYKAFNSTVVVKELLF